MEDGVKEDPARPKEVKFLGKAGWLKKSSGRFLFSYKDRYIHVEKTEIVVYENETLQTCLERVDLENYDKCLELRSPFKKNRLVLIRAPKSVNKVQAVKFQAQNPEEREAWIKALTDGIDRAKNKIFDEVKVDEDNNLEHVTRTRPKGNRNRRPPTRIHMKEVAIVSSDGILRLDLDVADSSTPNGTHYLNVDTTETPKEAIKPPMPPSKPSEILEEGQPDDSLEEGPQTGVLKPPMPPSKEAKATAAAAEDNPPKKKILMPPMPPSKDAKPAAPAEDEASKEDSPDNSPEKSPETGVEEGEPSIPPNKPTSGSTDNLAEAPKSSQDPKPPPPPSKDKKPVEPTPTPEITPPESDGVKNEDEEEVEEAEVEEEEESSQATLSDMKQNSVPESVTEVESSPSPAEEAMTNPVTELPEVRTTEEETPEVSKHSPEEKDSAPSDGVDTVPNEEPQMPQLKAATPPMPTSEVIKKSPGPPVPVKKKPIKIPPPKAVAQVEPKPPPTEETKSIVSDEKLNPPTTSPQTAPDNEAERKEELNLPVEPKTDAVVLSLTDPVADNPSPVSCHRSLEKREREEEKSVDSGQHSDDDGEGSESEDNLASAATAASGRQAGLFMDVSEDDTETPDSLGQSTDEDPPAMSPTEAHTAPLVSSPKVHSTFIQVQLNQTSLPPIPPKPLAKTRSASLGDLLSESPGCITKVGDGDGSEDANAPCHPVMDLEGIEALELEKNGETLGTVTSKESPESDSKRNSW